MKQFRFDDAYEQIHEYDEDHHAYLFCGTYLYYGVKKEMNYEQKSHAVISDREASDY